MRKQSRKEKGTFLEDWAAEKFKELKDFIARHTRGSGNKTEIGDVYTSNFFVECKSWNKKNVNIPISVINKLLSQLPINTEKIPIWIFENSENRKFVIMQGELFFKVLEPYIKKQKED